MSCCTNPQRDSLTVAVKENESAAQTGATKGPDLALGSAVTGAGLCRASPMRFLALLRPGLASGTFGAVTSASHSEQIGRQRPVILGRE